ncbi:Chloride channel protein ClC-Kb [Merluccius polli]|uniref:Chloride channel protein ClC-Kb n=1 Tax=Merluccius polli TaxID=89951 RepID=A0AA47N593_MERPO|nr:Chloride channel protein ClC-Kb [Merluccius polli]
MEGFDESSHESFSKSRAAGNQRLTSPNESLLPDDRWKPCLRSRALVKGQSAGCMQQLSRALGALGGAEWAGFMALGLLTAVISFFMDLSVSKLLAAHQWLYTRLEGHMALQLLCWTLYPAALCAVASSFSQHICPHATGSGLPEIRALLAGVDMPHYLSLTNLFVKLLGLTCTLAAGSTLFLGKVGPFVHLSTMVGAYLKNLCSLIGDNKRDGAGGEMLVVAAAAGVASCFGAPVSGVLFSMEAMSSHFPLKDYIPCFFSAACGATTFRLLSSLEPLFKTHFPESPPFCPQEIILFAVLGVACGVVSCIYLSLHRWMLGFTKTNRVLIHMLTTEKALYSAALAFFLALLTFPHSVGQYMASKYTMKQLLTSLLDESQWSERRPNSSLAAQPTPWSEWAPPGCSVFVSLSCFLLMKLWMLVLVCTLPVPAGYFMPVFVYGAAIGRLVGEGVAYLSPNGDPSDPASTSLTPGGYALAGAAAFSGAATHTLSPALLALELTGQLTHAGPVLLATLLANAVARYGQRPSFYDNISLSKRLPHLPSLLRVFPG